MTSTVDKTKQLYARAALMRMAEPGTLPLWRFVADVGPVEAVARLQAGSEDVPAIVWGLVRARLESGAIAQSRQDLDVGYDLGWGLAIPEDLEWPGDMLATADAAPPIGLWVKGELTLGALPVRAVAVVGSRASTAYGEHVAGQLGHDLARAGRPVVSGLGYGVDAAAHRGALSAQGPTVAVLAGGPGRSVYPSGHQSLADRIAETGLLVSEYPPGYAPQKFRFLARNRIIAELSAGMVVVEAAARSGSLAAARRAQERGRPVMAVPGPVTSAQSVGVHQLLRDGARLVTSARDVEAELGGGGRLAPAAAVAREALSETARKVLDALPLRVGVAPERIAGVAGVEVLEVLRVLPALELAGLAVWTGTGWKATAAEAVSA